VGSDDTKAQMDSATVSRHIYNYYYPFTTIIHDNLRQPASPVKTWRILLVQRFTARMPLLTATSAAFRLERRH